MKIAVIGGGASGMMFSVQYKKQNPEHEVIVFEKSPYVSWAGCPTPYYIAKELDFSHVVLNEPETFIKKGIDVNINHEVLELNEKEKYVLVKGSKYNGKVNYDKLIIAVGAKANLPKIEGIDDNLENVFTLNHATSAVAIDTFIENSTPKKATIIGLGFIGIELVEAFQKRGLEVSVIEYQDDIFKMLPVNIREKIKEELNKKQIKIYTSSTATKLIKSDNKVQKVEINNSDYLKTDMLVFSTGILPNISFLNNKLETKDGKILVNNKFETNIKDIYAVGDSVYNKYINSDRNVYAPFGDVANKHGLLLARYLSNKNIDWQGVQRSFASAFYDLKFAGTGLSLEEAKLLGYNAKVFEMRAQTENSGFETYRPINISIIYDEDKKIVLGAFGIGYESVAQFIDQISIVITLKTPIEEFINFDFCYSPKNATVWTPLLVLYRKVIK